MNNGIFKLKVFHRRSFACRSVALLSAFAMLHVAVLPAFAGDSLLGGNAVLEQLSNVTKGDVSDNSVVFSSTLPVGVLDWSKFNIGSDQTMTFNGASSTFFNLVDKTAGKSQIDGTINGSGNVWVINPSGVAFGNNAVVDVGGLFSAAAGNIENADDLRSGTATKPLFSSFEGAVDVGSAQFTANQVNLFGKSVTVASGANFEAVNALNVAAGKSLEIDEVSDGKVSVDITDFADFDSDINVTLGDMKIGDGTHAGTLDVKTEGSIVVAGEVLAQGDIAMNTLAKNPATDVKGRYIGVGSAASVESATGKVSLDAVGNVNVGGKVAAAGKVVLRATGGEEDTAKSVKIGFDGAAYSASASVSGSEVEMEGKMSSQVLAGSVTATKSVSMSGGEYVAVNGSVSGKNVTMKTTDLATLSGAHTDLGMSSGDPAGVIVTGLGSVKATGTLAVDSKGAILAQGTLKAKDADFTAQAGDVSAANEANDFSGKVTASGKDIAITDKNSLNLGDVTATGAVVADAKGGYLAVADGKTVQGGGDVKLTATGNVNVEGNVKSTDGDVEISATGAGKSVKIGYNGKSSEVSGKNVTLTGDKSAQVLAGSVTATETATMSGKEYVAINGAVSGKKVSLETTEADELSTAVAGFPAGSTAGVLVTANGSVAATEEMSITSKGGVQAAGSLSAGDSGTMSIVTAKGINISGKVTSKVESDFKADEGGVTLSNTGNEIGGTVNTKGDVNIAAGDKVDYVYGKVEAGSDGNLTIEGQGKDVEINEGVAISGDFKIENAEDIVLAEDVAAKTATMTASKTIVQDPDKSGKKLEAKDGIEMTAGEGVTLKGVVKADSDGENGGNLVVMKNATDGGALTQDGGEIRANKLTAAEFTQKGNGKLYARRIEANVTQKGCEIHDNGDGTITIDGDFTQEAGSVGGAAVSKITITGEFNQNASADTADTALVQAGELVLQGAATQGGELAGDTVKAEALTLLAGGEDISLASTANEFGTVRGVVDDLTLVDSDGGLVITTDISNQGLHITGTGNITTSGDLTQDGQFVTAGELSVSAANVVLTHGWNRFCGGVTANATADNGSVRLTHRGDILGCEVVDIKGIEAGVDGKRGDVRVEAIEGGGISVSGDVNGNNVTLYSVNGITEGAAVNAAADKYVHATGGDINVNANATVGGNVAYFADGDSALVKTAMSGSIASGPDGAAYIKDSSGGRLLTGGSMTSEGGVTTFTGATKVSIDTKDSVVVNNDGIAVTVGVTTGGGQVTEVLSDPVGGESADGTAAVDLGSGAAGGIAAKSVTISVMGDPGATAVNVRKGILARDGDVKITTEAGDIVVDGATVKAGTFTVDETTGAVDDTAADYTVGNLELVAGGGVKLENGASVGASGTAVVTANGEAGVVVDGSRLASHDNMAISATKVDAGSITIENGYVGTHGTLDITAAKDVSIDPSIVESTDDLTITAAGDFTLDADSRVGTSGNLVITASGATGINAEGVLVANEAGKTTTLQADNGAISAENADNDFGSVTASAKSVTLKDKDTLAMDDVTATEGAADVEVVAGNVTVNGVVTATTDAKVKASDGAIEVASTGSVAGDVSTTLDGKSGVSGSGAVGKAGSALKVDAADGAIELTGVVLGTTAEFAAKDAVSVANANNDFTDVVTASGSSVTLNDKNDIELADVQATTGGVTVTADNDVTVSGNVVAKTDASVDAGNDAIISGTVDAEGNVMVTAANDAIVRGTVTAKTDATVVAGNDAAISGTVDAEGNATVTAANDATISGTVEADGVAAVTGAKNATVAGGASVKGANASVVATEKKATVEGAVEGTATTASVTAGTDADISGTVTAKTDATVVAGNDAAISGTVDAEGNATVTAANDATISGKVEADGVAAVTGAKNATVAGGASVKGVSASVVATEKKATVEGAVEGTETTASVTAGTDADISGTVTAKTDATVKADNDAIISGAVTAKTDATVEAGNDATISGTVDAEGNATVTAANDATISGKVEADGVAAVTGAKNATVASGASVKGASASVVATAEKATVAGAVEGTATTASVTAGTDADISGTVTAKTDATVEAGNDATISGTVDAEGNATVTAVNDANISGKVEADGVAVVSGAKNATVASGASVKGAIASVVATAEKATVEGAVEGTETTASVTAGTDVDVSGAVTAKTDATIVAANDATVSGTVDADGNATVIAGNDATISGTVEADGVAAVTGAKNATVAGGASVKGANASVVATEKKATVEGSVEATATTASVTAGTDADVSGTVTAKTDATVEAGNDVTISGAVDVEGNATVEAGNDATVSGMVEADGVAAVTGAKNATVASGASVKGASASVVATVEKATVAGAVEGTETTASVTAGTDADISGTVTAKTDATVEAGNNATISGTVDAEGNATVTSANDATISGTVTAKADVLATAGNNVEISGTIDSGNNMHLSTGENGGDVTIAAGSTIVAAQNATVIAGKDVNLNGNVTAVAGDVYVDAMGGDVTMANGNVVEAGNNAFVGADDKLQISKVKASNVVWLKTNNGSIVNESAYGIDGVNVESTQLRVDAKVNVGSSAQKLKTNVISFEAKAEMGSVFVEENDAVTIGAGNFAVNKVGADGSIEAVSSGARDGISSSGDIDFKAGGSVTIAERVSAGGVANIESAGDVEISAATTVSGAAMKLDATGDVTVNGTVAVSGDMVVDAGGDVTFGANGQVSGANVAVTADDGDITQDGAVVQVKRGSANKTDIHPAVVASGAAVLVAGGSIGAPASGTAEYVGVDAQTVSAKAGGGAAIAGASGKDLSIGDGGIEAGGTVSLYTSGTVRPNGNTIKAGGGVSVTAKNYQGGIVGVALSSPLTVNSIGSSGGAPLLAIFETRGGSKSPTITSQPNNAVVFLDGRLAGGDITVINKLGALEAFPVQTPELKSEQGVFGNPTFLHDELDVANPFAVGAIDFLLMDIPRLLLSSDFPVEADRHLAANGLSPTTSYWFGQKDKEATEEEEEK